MFELESEATNHALRCFLHSPSIVLVGFVVIALFLLDAIELFEHVRKPVHLRPSR